MSSMLRKSLWISNMVEEIHCFMCEICGASYKLEASAELCERICNEKVINIERKDFNGLVEPAKIGKAMYGAQAKDKL